MAAFGAEPSLGPFVALRMGPLSTVKELLIYFYQTVRGEMLKTDQEKKKFDADKLKWS